MPSAEDLWGVGGKALASRVASAETHAERLRLIQSFLAGRLRRLSRFQKTVRTLMLDAGSRCADAALAQGYYDQAHFVRDFRELVSDSPRRHLEAARAEAGNVRYAVHRQKANPEAFVLYELYRDATACDEHLVSPPVRQALQRFESLLSAPPRIVFCDLIAASGK